MRVYELVLKTKGLLDNILLEFVFFFGRVTDIKLYLPEYQVIHCDRTIKEREEEIGNRKKIILKTKYRGLFSCIASICSRL